jgi:hypothetical protein
MSDQEIARRGVLPRIGPRAPGWTIRLAVIVVGLGLCFTQLPPGFWFGLGVLLTLLAAVFPRIPWAWALLILCGACVFLHPVGPPPGSLIEWRIAALIAGAHLIHLLASYAAVFPVRGWVALSAFRGSAVRYLIIQLPVQIAAAVVLFVIARVTLPPVPVAGAIAAIALVGVALAVLAALLLERRRL